MDVSEILKLNSLISEQQLTDQNIKTLCVKKKNPIKRAQFSEPTQQISTAPKLNFKIQKQDIRVINKQEQIIKANKKDFHVDFYYNDYQNSYFVDKNLFINEDLRIFYYDHQQQKDTEQILFDLTKLKQEQIILFDDVKQGLNYHFENNKKQANFGNLRFDYEGNNQAGILNKLIIENDLKFKYTGNEHKINFCYYDIETYNGDLQNHSVPLPEDENAHIGIICFYNSNENKITTFLNGSYQYDEQQINEHIQKKNNEYFLMNGSQKEKKTIQNIKYEYKHYHNEYQLSRGFIAFLQEFKEIIILVGFNSSVGQKDQKKNSYKKQQIVGYDISFIMHRSLYQYSVKFASTKLYNQNNYNQVKYINILPCVYFVDYSVLCFMYLEPLERQKIKNHKLDTYLQLWINLQKIEIDYQELQKKLHNITNDITYEIAYCQFDVLSLYLLNRKKNFLELQMCYIDLLNLPLNIALYSTQSFLNQLKLQQLYFKNNYLCNFQVDRLVEISQEQNAGAICIQMEQEFQNQIIKNTCMCDYSGLYPSALIIHNICLSTMKLNEVDEEKYFIVKFDDQQLEKNNQITSVGFLRNQKGVLSQYSKDLITQRDQAKGEMKKLNKKIMELKIEFGKSEDQNQMEFINGEIENAQKQYNYYNLAQYLYKIQNNSLYGLLGSIYSIFKSEQSKVLSAAITQIGRNMNRLMQQAIEAQGKIMLWSDTDSSNIQLDDEICNFGKLTTMHKRIQNFIDRRMVQNKIYFDVNGGIFGHKFNLELENVFPSAYFPVQKKSYQKYKINPRDYNKFLGMEQIIKNFDQKYKINPTKIFLCMDQLIKALVIYQNLSDQVFFYKNFQTFFNLRNKIQEDKIKNMESQFKNLQGQINNILDQKLSEVETENFIQNSYQRSHEIKGISWGFLTKEIQEETGEFFRKILNKSENQNINDLVDEYVTNQSKQIQNMIKTKDYELLKKYSQRLKLSEKNPIAKKLRENPDYHELISASQCFYVVLNNKHTQKISENAKPIQFLKDDDFQLINQTWLFKSIFAPIKKFFNSGNNIKIEEFIQNVEEKPENVVGFWVVSKNKKEICKSIQKDFYVEDIEKIIKTKGNEQMFGEKIFGDIETQKFKGYFDVDCPFDYNIDQKDIIEELKTKHFSNVKMHVCSNNEKKISCHIVVDQLMTKQQLKAIGINLNKHFQKNIFDLLVYKQNALLRIPQCVKVYRQKNGKAIIDPRKLEIITDSTITDFLITNTGDLIDSDVYQLFAPRLEFQKSIKLALNKEQQIDICNLIFGELQIKFRIKSYINGLIYLHLGIKCPFSKEKENQKKSTDSIRGYLKMKNRKFFFVYYCCKNEEDKQQIAVEQKIIEGFGINTEICEVEQIYKDLQKQSKEINPACEYLDDQELNYQINVRDQIIFIKSAMGTGKTKSTVEQQIIKDSNSLVILSFRRAFTQFMQHRYRANSYQNIKGQIDLDKEKRIIIQVDSLTRLKNIAKIDVLIIDEVESIISQLKSAQMLNFYKVLQKFIDLVRSSKLIICMDAKLRKCSRQFILWIRNTSINSQNIRYIENKKNTHKDIQLFYNDVPKHTIAAHMLKTLQNLLNQGKRVVIPVSSVKIAQLLHEFCNEKNIKNLPITGDQNYFVKPFQKSMVDLKESVMTNLDDFLCENNIQVFIYTASITSGISLEKWSADIVLTSFSGNPFQTMDIYSFSQMWHRVREIKEKQIIMFANVSNVYWQLKGYEQTLGYNKQNYEIFLHNYYNYINTQQSSEMAQSILNYHCNFIINNENIDLILQNDEFLKNFIVQFKQDNKFEKIKFIEYELIKKFQKHMKECKPKNMECSCFKQSFEKDKQIQDLNKKIKILKYCSRAKIINFDEENEEKLNGYLKLFEPGLILDTFIWDQLNIIKKNGGQYTQQNKQKKRQEPLHLLKQCDRTFQAQMITEKNEEYVTQQKSNQSQKNIEKIKEFIKDIDNIVWINKNTGERILTDQEMKEIKKYYGGNNYKKPFQEDIQIGFNLNLKEKQQKQNGKNVRVYSLIPIIPLEIVQKQSEEYINASNNK